ncbi:MAG TPA: SAM-dependent methyltransferase [Chitinophagaceae bacterium]|nr:SAM-dependent methyltransferase [Chitinophagaceae bacterium]
MPATVYLIPTVLADGVTETLPAYILPALQQCTVFFVENERTARRFFKLLWKEMPIDTFAWHAIKEVTPATEAAFREAVANGLSIGIVSEAGCPGVADPGQRLVHLAQAMDATVRPLVGPSSILLALMGSGMNGQQFQFVGYLPIEAAERVKSIRSLESESRQKQCTQIFIETPYRNNQLLEVLLKTLQPQTQLCIAADLTAPTEFLRTRSVAQWKKGVPELHKRPVIFLLYAG